MVDSALAKLQWASKRISELNDIVTEERPFTYVVETNNQTGYRSTFAKRNETTIANCSLACGEIIQNIRSSLDHAYWDIVSPFAKTPREQRAVQFPFSETAARLAESIKNRLANRVSQRFYNALIALAPHGDDGGNKLLYLIDKLNVPDKHRTLTPIGDYKTISSKIIRRQVPDFPAGIVSCNFGMNRRDVTWTFGSAFGADGGIVEKELDVPVNIVLPIPELNGLAPMIPTLNDLLRTADDTIKVIRDAA